MLMKPPKELLEDAEAGLQNDDGWMMDRIHMHRVMALGHHNNAMNDLDIRWFAHFLRRGHKTRFEVLMLSFLECDLLDGADGVAAPPWEEWSMHGRAKLIGRRLAVAAARWSTSLGAARRWLHSSLHELLDNDGHNHRLGGGVYHPALDDDDADDDYFRRVAADALAGDNHAHRLERALQKTKDFTTDVNDVSTITTLFSSLLKLTRKNGLDGVFFAARREKTLFLHHRESRSLLLLLESGEALLFKGVADTHHCSTSRGLRFTRLFTDDVPSGARSSGLAQSVPGCPLYDLTDGLGLHSLLFEQLVGTVVVNPWRVDPREIRRAKLTRNGRAVSIKLSESGFVSL